MSGSTVYRTKRRFVEGNLERALSEEPRPGAERKITGKEETCRMHHMSLRQGLRSKPCWWRPPAPVRRRAAPAGRLSCWQARCSSLPSTRSRAASGPSASAR